MKNITTTLIFTLGVCLVVCASNSKSNAPSSQLSLAAPTVAGTNVLSDEKARISYAIGMTFAHNFQVQGVEVDPDILARGLKDMLSGGSTLLTKEEVGVILSEFQKSSPPNNGRSVKRLLPPTKLPVKRFWPKTKPSPGSLLCRMACNTRLSPMAPARLPP